MTGTLHNVMQSDSQSGVRAMSYYTENPASIAALFDNVIYSKCELILMFYENCYKFFVIINCSWKCLKNAPTRDDR